MDYVSISIWPSLCIAMHVIARIYLFEDAAVEWLSLDSNFAKLLYPHLNCGGVVRFSRQLHHANRGAFLKTLKVLDSRSQISTFSFENKVLGTPFSGPGIYI